jgi:toxin YoeB
VEVDYTDEAHTDILFWKKSGNKTIQKRIKKLIEDIQKTPFKGIGKPEQLKYKYSGLWSRRITDADRLIYEVDENENIVYVHSLRGHYE